MQIPRPPRRFFDADSGYGTGAETSFSSLISAKSIDARQSVEDENLADAEPKSVPLPGREDLLAFKVDVSYAVTARFREILPEIERVIHKDMQKGLAIFKPSRARDKKQMVMSIRLMTVGEASTTAKSTIVVFVQGEQVSSLEGCLLKNPLVQQLRQPNDGITPEFDIVVAGESPRKRFLQEGVSAEWDLKGKMTEQQLTTYCGIRISLNSGYRSAAATLGGVVKLTFGPGDFMLVGMTAGHVLEDLLGPDDPAKDFETLLDSEPKLQLAALASCSLETEQEPQRRDEHAAFNSRREIGNLFYPRPHSEIRSEEEIDEAIPARDWALLEINSNLKIKPNRLPRRLGPGQYMARMGGHGAHHGHCLVTAPAESFPEDQPKEVVMLNSSISEAQGSLLGTLSNVPARVMLNPAKGFVEAYLLTLDNGEVQDGDSGAWVVNPITKEVYGHVVATDCTGDAYVVPLHSSLADMKELLDVESVDLPTTADLLDMALRRTSSTGNIATDSSQNRGQGQVSLGVTHKLDVEEQRASEVMMLCEGLHPDVHQRMDDGDSGYGSVGTTPRDMFLEGPAIADDCYAW
ncbi:hypothetical protein B0T19DRAFT_458142 [Cercophora scortea]|uniref:Uncharacterized protein n=1 Tax=Cercophora scortea TaxID=314031 RepID=A0AAE0IYU8_9PEZI|nr:hypothetical protein B0T19DRAFT_458142 [Cercophora scortea]